MTQFEDCDFDELVEVQLIQSSYLAFKKTEHKM